LADIEWTAQLLQLRHAASVPALRTTRTLGVLRAVADEGLLAADDVDALVSAWRLASRVRNAIMLVRGKADDSLPRDLRDLTGLARMVGYAPGEAGALPEDYRRTTRRARAVVERVFYA
jgi:glutamate-ammonia-ligase adenylyltransferase